MSKRDEHILVFKIRDCIKAISDIISDKIQDDFIMNQLETSSDVNFIFSEISKETESIDRDPVELNANNQPTKIKLDETQTPPVHSPPPSVKNVPIAKPTKIFKKPLTPEELKPVVIDPSIGPWFKYPRLEYNIPIEVDSIKLTPDDIIFSFMICSLTSKSSNIANRGKELRTCMFMNEEQLYHSSNHSLLPIRVNYNNLLDSGVLEKIDIGYSVRDIRSLLPNPNVKIDPMYKRIDLYQILDLINEDSENFILSQTIQSYIYSYQYQLDLQPVVAICFALLVDGNTNKDKVNFYSKHIPWVFTIIKLHLMGRTDFKNSANLKFLHQSFVSELEDLCVNTIEDLLEYSGENTNAIKLKFLVTRKIERLRIKVKHLDKVPLLSKTQQDIMKTEQSIPKTEIGNDNKIKTIATVKRNLTRLKINNKDETQISDEILDSFIPSAIDEELFSFNKSIISLIQNTCAQAIKETEKISPKELLINIFTNIVLPAIINYTPSSSTLNLIEIFNEVGELAGVVNTVDFSRNLGDMEERWNEYPMSRERIIKSFANRLEITAKKFQYTELFRDLLKRKIDRNTI